MKVSRWIAILLCITSIYAHAAGFDCGKATTNIEKMLCADPEISALDEQMATAYQTTLEKTDDRKTLEAQQLQWLKGVRNACTDIDCLNLAYPGRISTLKEMALQWDVDNMPEPVCGAFDQVIEKKIQGDAQLKNLKHFVGITYKTAFYLEKDAAAQKHLQREQCDWQTSVAQCKDSACAEEMLKARLDKLSNGNFSKVIATPGQSSCPEDAFMVADSDRMFCLRRFVSKARLDLDRSSLEDQQDCSALSQALTTGSVQVSNLDPIIRTHDLLDPHLAAYRECSGPNGKGDWAVGKFNMNGKTVRLYRFGGQNSDEEWIFQEGANFPIYRENGSYQGMIGAYIARANTETCEVVNKGLGMTDGDNVLHILVRHQGDVNFFEVTGRQFVTSSKYDLSKNKFSEKPSCHWSLIK